MPAYSPHKTSGRKSCDTVPLRDLKNKRKFKTLGAIQTCGNRLICLRFCWCTVQCLSMGKTGKCVPKSKQLIYLRFSLFTDHLWWQVYHGWSSSLYLVPITLFSVLYNIPKFFELEVQNLSKKTTCSYTMKIIWKLLSSTRRSKIK